MSAPAYPPIPYGRASFPSIRRDGCLYVDKTRFIREIEEQRYVFFVRPRRFGKTLWLATLECYYDRRRRDDFETLFRGTDIGRNPTPHRNRYVILYFDFSAFDDAPETLAERFQNYCATQLAEAMEGNPDLFPAADMRRILGPPGVDGKLNELFRHVRLSNISLYVLIDEYDNFANTILAAEGPDAYHAFTHGGGFYRSFFATLKAGTAREGSVDRLFVTGVSPITMDDVTSGFNIGANLSLMPECNELLGFTEAEVRRVLAMYRQLGVFSQESQTALHLMHEWYNGYRFAVRATDDVYNPDLVLHYLKHSLPNKGGPEQLIDNNVRIDYGKLRHLLMVGKRAKAASMPAEAADPDDEKLGGNFDMLRDAAADAELRSPITPSFPLKLLDEPENFTSLLYYFGLLSIRGTSRGLPVLAIPNQTVRKLMYGYLRDAYRDVGVFSANLRALDELVWTMAREGRWRPAIEHLADAIGAQTSIRDYIHGEKTIQGFVAAYLACADCFVFHPEMELAKGYADIVLQPFSARYPELRHGYVIELKYLPLKAGPARTQSTAAAAVSQLHRYLGDAGLARRFPGVSFTGIALVFRGWELVHGDEVRSE